MAINYRKIKSQIMPHTDERHGSGHLFQATKEQEADDVCSVFVAGRASKRRLIDCVASLSNTDAYFAKHFKLTTTNKPIAL